MIAALAAGLLAKPWARTALRSSAGALAVILFLLSLRRAGERAGCLAERLETMEKADVVHRRMLEAAARQLGGLVMKNGQSLRSARSRNISTATLDGL